MRNTVDFLLAVAKESIETAISAIELSAEGGELLRAGGIASDFAGRLNQEQKNSLTSDQSQKLVDLVAKAVAQEYLLGGYAVQIGKALDLNEEQENKLIRSLFQAPHLYDVKRLAQAIEVTDRQKRMIGQCFLEADLDHGFDAPIEFMQKVGFPQDIERKLRDKLGYHHKSSG